MRRILTTFGLVSAGAALFVGLGSPAHGATPAVSAATVAASDSYWFGSYYTLDACRYFGESLVAAGQWRYYLCIYEHRTGQPQAYWYLYMYN